MHTLTTVLFFVAVFLMAALWAGHPFKRIDWERPRMSYMLAIVFISISSNLAALVWRDGDAFTWALSAAIVTMGTAAALLFYALCLMLRAIVLTCRVIKLKHRARFVLCRHLPAWDALNLAMKDRADEWPDSSLRFVSEPRK